MHDEYQSYRIPREDLAQQLANDYRVVIVSDGEWYNTRIYIDGQLQGNLNAARMSAIALYPFRLEGRYLEKNDSEPDADNYTLSDWTPLISPIDPKGDWQYVVGRDGERPLADDGSMSSPT